MFNKISIANANKDNKLILIKFAILNPREITNFSYMVSTSFSFWQNMFLPHYNSSNIYNMCLLVRLLVLQFFLDIAACFSASKSNATSPSEESIFFILAKGMH